MNDLLKQKRLLQLLKDDQQLFDELLNNSKESIILIDKNYQIREWNYATELITDISKENVRGISFLELLGEILPKIKLNPDLEKFIENILQNIFNGQNSRHLNKTIHLGIINKQNEKKYINTFITGISQNKNLFVGIISKDVTEEKLFRRTVHQNKKHLDILFNNDAIGIAIGKPDGGFYKVNQKFIDIVGFSFDELKKFKLIDLIHADDQQKELELFEETKNKKGRKYSFKKRIKQKNGNTLWVRSHVNFQWSSDSHLEMIVVFLEDISSQKKAEDALHESEKKYRFVAEKASDIIYSISLDRKITFYNRAAERIFETPVEELAKHEYSHLMVPKDKEFAKKLHQQRLEGKKSPIFRHAFKTPKGKIVHLEFSVNPLFDDNHQVIGSLGIARDITDRVKAEEKINEKNIQLEELVKTKNKLLSIIAHDLRDPFNILMGFSEVLLEQYHELTEQEKIKYLQQINSAANNGFDLLTNLLDWSKTQTDRIYFTPKEINLTKVIHRVLLNLKNSALAKNITLNYHPVDESKVHLDENMLLTVLRNLIKNAIKFSYKNATITISTVENNNEIIVYVKDYGTGIKEEEIEQILNKKINFTKPGTEYEKGTGLGLIICKEFIEQWGGTLNIHSEYGNGSTFYFNIPKNKHSLNL
ncbi:MAG: PAS domain-containing sensor histidine kinase [Bacteroidales bacterium]|jgi:PAS domain S-box-containing protein|nr:PAS domain-containing sensor histidine kinase [Bacteroidales bacterium]